MRPADFLPATLRGWASIVIKGQALKHRRPNAPSHHLPRYGQITHLRQFASVISGPRTSELVPVQLYEDVPASVCGETVEDVDGVSRFPVSSRLAQWPS